MSAVLAWVGFTVVVGLLALTSWLIIQRYSDPLDDSKLTKWIAVVALTTALACALLVPVDVFVVSHFTNADSVQVSATATASRLSSLYAVYYTLYLVILACVFLLLPFGYFFYEEEEEEFHRGLGHQVRGALKYTGIFVAVLVVLMVVGGVVAHNGVHPESASDTSIGHKFTALLSMGDSILGFSVAVVTLLGLVGWVSYTAYGLAYLPVKVWPGPRYSAHVDAADLKTSLLKIQGRMEYLQAKKLSGGFTDSDQTILSNLTLEHSKLTHMASSSSSPQLSFPFRIGAACLALATSLLIVISYTVTLIDKAMHSSISSGLLLDQDTLVSPVNSMLVHLSSVFPLDYLFYGIVILYLFTCSLVGLLDGGVRLLCLQMYSFHPRGTPQNALLMGVWLLCFVLVAINLQTVVLLPQYTAFGHQTLAGVPCSLSDVSTADTPSTCVITAIARFINSVTSSLPVFGIVYFVFGVVFVLVYYILAGVLLYKRVTQKPSGAAPHYDLLLDQQY